MSNTGGTRVPKDWGDTGGMTLGGVGAPEAGRGTRGAVTRGWRKRGLAAWRRTKKAKRLAVPKPAKPPKPAGEPSKAPPKPKRDWLDTLDEKSVDDLVNRQAYQKYHPAFQEIAAQKRISDVQQKRIGDWYGQYRQQIGEAAKANARAYGGAVGLVQGAGERMAAQDEANRQALAAEQRADAERRGVAYSPGNDVVSQQAAGSRLAASNSFAAMLAAQGAAGVSRLQQQSNVVVPGQQLQARMDESARKRALEAKALDLLREKGDYRITLKDQKRESERKFLLEKTAFNLKSEAEKNREALDAAKLAVQQAKDASDRKLALARLRIAQQNADANTQRANRQPSSGGSGGGSKPKKPAKPSEAYYKAMQSYQGIVNQYGTGQSDYKVAATNRKVPRVVVLAAHEFARTGRVSGRIARMWLDAFGTPLPMRYRDGSQKAPYPSRTPNISGEANIFA